jgi:hypothetical protein
MFLEAKSGVIRKRIGNDKLLNKSSEILDDVDFPKQLEENKEIELPEQKGNHFDPYTTANKNKWVDVFQCESCGSVGDIVSLGGTYEPCSHCGQKKKKNITAKWVGNYWKILKS